MWQNRLNRYEEINFKNRLKHIFLFIFILFIILLGRLFFLQIIKFHYFKYFSENNRIYIESIKSPRGRILDAYGKILVDNRKVYTLVFSKLCVEKSRVKEVLEELKKYFNFNEQKILSDIKNINKKSDEIIIARDIPKELTWLLIEKKPYLRGIDILDDSIRDYKLGYESAHIFGYVSEMTEQEFEVLEDKGYKSNDIIGKTGIEKKYDEYLKGTDGFKAFEVDVRGRKKRLLNEVSCQEGADVYTTIDYDLQKKLEEIINGQLGTIIVLDTKNSKVLGMVSYPGYDANQFLYNIKEEKRNVFTATDYPMLNRAIQTTYPPASIFKIVTTAAALEENIVNPKEIILCEGGIYFGKEDRYFKCWKKDGHGRLNLEEAFKQSCDVYFYNLADRLGVRNLYKYAKLMGLNDKTGIDLPYERRGFVPTPEWKYKRFKMKWFDGDTLNMGIGQGFLLTTPLALTNMVVTLLNGGNLHHPYIIESIIKDDKFLFHHSNNNDGKKNIFRKGTVDFIMHSMFETVNNGTGKAAYLENLGICGKTGTAQNPHGEDHAWFIGFAPYKNPQIVVGVFIENGGGGGSVAAPIAKKVFEYYLSRNIADSIKASAK